MWTAGFPEPQTFSLRVARLLQERARRLRRRPRQPGARLRHARHRASSACRWSPRIHHPITFDRRDRPRGRPDLAQAADAAPLVRLPADAGQGRPPARPDPDRLGVARARDIVTRLRRRPGPDAGRSRSASTTCSSPPTAPRVPGRIVAMASADAPMKGIATLLEAFAKLRTERDVELLLVTQARARRPHRAARRPSSAIGDAVRFVHGITDAELRRADRLGRGRLRALALRGLLAADRRGDGLRAPRWSSAGPARIPEVVGPDGVCADLVDAGRRRRAGARRSRRCSTTRSGVTRDGRGRPRARRSPERSAGARWPRPPPTAYQRRSPHSTHDEETPDADR